MEEKEELLIKCKACGKMISKNATTCPNCGEPSENTKPDFICSKCNYGTNNWALKCPSCGSLNTFIDNSQPSSKNQKSNTTQNNDIDVGGLVFGIILTIISVIWMFHSIGNLVGGSSSNKTSSNNTQETYTITITPD